MCSSVLGEHFENRGVLLIVTVMAGVLPVFHDYLYFKTAGNPATVWDSPTQWGIVLCLTQLPNVLSQ